MDFENTKYFKLNNKDRYNEYYNKHKNLNANQIVESVNLNLDYEHYTHIENAVNIDTNLVLVNKHYKLDETYIPKNLTKIDYKYTSGLEIYADKEATKYFKEMSNTASLLNLKIKTMSAYRDYEYQKNLYNNYLENDEVSIVDTYSARAGHSEHQTGLAFDIYNEEKSYMEFGNTEEYKWICNNAYKFGFILRYKKEFESITGYKNEPWHIRYVGIEAATYIYMNDITLEEYILEKI